MSETTKGSDGFQRIPLRCSSCAARSSYCGNNERQLCISLVATKWDIDPLRPLPDGSPRQTCPICRANEHHGWICATRGYTDYELLYAVVKERGHASHQLSA